MFDTPLGQMGLAEEDGAIVRLYLPGHGTEPGHHGIKFCNGGQKIVLRPCILPFRGI